jgi:HD-GYP domain-containing protein (c-di-GMP phosphodiesterase class II)
MPKDNLARHPIGSDVEPAARKRASREELSTGELLTKLGNRVGQPVRRAAPARKPLLSAKDAASAPDSGVPEQDSRLAAVVGLLKQIEAWDKSAVERARSVARYAVAIAGTLAPAAELPRIRNAALLCNVGLMSVPREVLTKVEALTPAEQQLIRRHAIYGADILQGTAPLRDELVLVLHHHEDYDGGGYPYGVSGDWIPLGARIIRVAETYDALLQPRPYRPALTPAEALSTLQTGSGRYFDPYCVAALATYLAR